MNAELREVTKQKLVSDFRTVVADAEELLRIATTETGEKLNTARAKFTERLKEAKVKLEDAEAVVVDKTKQAARATDTYVHEHPWKSVGVAAGVGLIIGLLIGRR